jgi:hypothetical protein
MDLDLLFTLANLSVLPAWVLLIALPKWSVTEKLVHSMLYPLILGTGYSIGLILSIFGGMGAEDGGFTSIAGVRALFAADMGLLIGWVHYLVFDLFVGAWAARDAKRRGVSHVLLIPCLLLTFMAGPFGLLLYVVLRKVTGKGGWSLFETS